MKSAICLCIFALLALVFTSCGAEREDVQERFLTETTTPVSIIPGAEMSMAITEDGSLWGWGWYVPNLINDRSNTELFRTTPMHMMDNVAYVSVGFRNKFIITANNALYAWGENGVGQLGDGTTINRSSPMHIMENVIAVSAGTWHTLAISSKGELWAWGVNDSGQLGDGTTTLRQTPVPVMENIYAVAAGRWHSIALSTCGVMWEFGNGSLTPIVKKENVIAIAANNFFSFAITADDVLYVWPAGEDYHVARKEDVIAVSAASVNNFAITSCFTLWDLGDFSLSPVPVMENIAFVYTGEGRNLAIAQDGSVWSWGTYFQGYRHPGSYTIFKERLEPVQIMCAAGFVPDCIALQGRWMMISSTCEDRGSKFSASNPLVPNNRQLMFQENGVLYIISTVPATGFVNYYDEFNWEITNDGQRLLIMGNEGCIVYDFVITRNNNSAGIFNILTLSNEEYTDSFVRRIFLPLPERLRE